MNTLKRIDRMLGRFFRAGYYVCGFLLAVLLCLCFVNVLMRIMQMPLSWADEAMRFIMIWMAFLACPVLIDKKSHLVVDLVSTFFHKESTKKIMYAIGNFFLLAFLIFLLTPCIELVAKNMISKSSAMRIPMGYIYLCIPISIALSIIAQIRLLCHDIFLKERGNGSDPSSSSLVPDGGELE